MEKTRMPGSPYPNLDFAGKVRRRMALDRNPLLVRVQDKVAVKEYARERGVDAAGLFCVTDDATSLALDSLPATCFIKANHGCRWNVLRQDGEYYWFGGGRDILDGNGDLVKPPELDRFRATQAHVTEFFEQILLRRWAEKEWAYQQIPPRIFVEEVLRAADGGELKDYRFYTFDGVVRAVNVGCPSYRYNRENAFFTPDWEFIPLTVYEEKLPDPLPGRPGLLAEMVAAAERLGAGLDFIRVDLYETTRGVMLGEMTVYPDSGLPDTPTACPRFNQWLGDAWWMAV